MVADGGLHAVVHGFGGARAEPADDQRDRRAVAGRLVDGGDDGRETPTPRTHGIGDEEDFLSAVLALLIHVQYFFPGFVPARQSRGTLKSPYHRPCLAALARSSIDA